jgi:hypothetical protein
MRARCSAWPAPLDMAARGIPQQAESDDCALICALQLPELASAVGHPIGAGSGRRRVQAPATAAATAAGTPLRRFSPKQDSPPPPSRSGSDGRGRHAAPRPTPPERTPLRRFFPNRTPRRRRFLPVSLRLRRPRTPRNYATPRPMAPAMEGDAQRSDGTPCRAFHRNTVSNQTPLHVPKPSLAPQRSAENMAPIELVASTIDVAALCQALAQWRHCQQSAFCALAHRSMCETFEVPPPPPRR